MTGPPRKAARIVLDSDADQAFPVTHVQEERFRSGGGRHFAFSGGLTFEGRFDLPALVTALRRLLRRHTYLGAVFGLRTGGAVVSTRTDIEPVFRTEREVPAGTPQGERWAAALEIIGAHRRTPFDLRHGPLFRAVVVRLDAGRSVLDFTMDHILADAQSRHILLRDLVALYRQAATGEPARLPVLERTFTDFCVQERAFLSGENLREISRVWAERLRGVDPIPESRLYDPDAPAGAPGVGVTERTLGPAEKTRLEHRCRQTGVSTAMATTAALTFAAGAMRAEAGDPAAGDVAFMASAANRAGRQWQHVFGYFATPNVLRTDLTGAVTVEDTLLRARGTILHALRYQRMPHSLLISQLKPELYGVRQLADVDAAPRYLNFDHVKRPDPFREDIDGSVVTPFRNTTPGVPRGGLRVGPGVPGPSRHARGTPHRPLRRGLDRPLRRCHGVVPPHGRHRCHGCTEPAGAHGVAACRVRAGPTARGRVHLPAGARILYSLKANPHPLLVETLRTQGFEAEVSSVGEMDVALDGGHAPERLLYSGPGKSTSHLRAALAAGVRTFSVESVTDRDRLDALAERAGAECRHLVRLNGPAGSAGGSLRMAGRPTAFGVDTTDTEAVRSLLTRRKHTRPVGLHTYFATNVGDEDGLIAEFQQAVHTASEVCRDAGFAPGTLDLGGGFPAPHAVPGGIARHPRLAVAVENALDRDLAGWRAGDVEITFESGRYLVAAAGTLVTEVLDVKRSRGQTFTVLDAGVNALGGMSGLGRLMSPDVRPYRLAPSRRTRPPDTADAPVVTLVGPLCTPLGVLNRSVDIGEVRVGDLLAVPNVGAYGLTASLVGFLSHPLPVEVVHTGARVESVRRLTLEHAGRDR